MTSNRQWQVIGPQEARQLLRKGGVQFVDVREQDEYDAGHIPGITHIPLSQFTERAGELDPNRELVLVCRSGNRSGKACDYLQSIGYRHLTNLAGGMNDWDGDVE